MSMLYTSLQDNHITGAGLRALCEGLHGAQLDGARVSSSTVHIVIEDDHIEYMYILVHTVLLDIDRIYRHEM